MDETNIVSDWKSLVGYAVVDLDVPSLSVRRACLILHPDMRVWIPSDISTLNFGISKNYLLYINFKRVQRSQGKYIEYNNKNS